VRGVVAGRAGRLGEEDAFGLVRELGVVCLSECRVASLGVETSL